MSNLPRHTLHCEWLIAILVIFVAGVTYFIGFTSEGQILNETSHRSSLGSHISWYRIFAARCGSRYLLWHCYCKNKWRNHKAKKKMLIVPSEKAVNMLGMWRWRVVRGRCWDSLGSWRSHYHTKATLLGNLSKRCSLARGAAAAVAHWHCNKHLTNAHTYIYTNVRIQNVSHNSPPEYPLRSPWHKHCLYSDIKYLRSGNINHTGQL